MSLGLQKALESSYVMNTFARMPVEFVEGHGMTLVGDDGTEYRDFLAGIGVCSLGYCHPVLVEAIQRQAERLLHVSNYYYIERRGELAAILSKLASGDMDGALMIADAVRAGDEAAAVALGLPTENDQVWKTFFANSGAEANEGAMKLARLYAKRSGNGGNTIVALRGSFHGRTLTTVTATGQDTFHKFFGPFTPGFRYVPAGDLAALERQLDAEDCSAVLVEIVQGEGGVRALDADYLKAVEALCHEKNVLFCVDEVQTGNGRTGTWFAYEQFGLSPDLVSTAKGLGNGLPIGATLMGPKTAEVLTPGTHGSTFGGNPVACAGALSVLEQIDDAFLEAVKQKGAWLTAELEKIPGVKDVSGLGLMLGFSVEGCKSADIKAKALDNGLVVLTAKDRVRLLPPLAITEEELSDGLLRLAAAIREVQEAAH